jgi:hypothetical protein
MRTQLGIPFCGTKIKKILGIPFELFRGKEHNSEFLSVQLKIETNSQNAVPNHSVEEKPTQNKKTAA